jgi:hypothetical protein
MAVMVSDGSYKPLLLTEIGAAAWILECSATLAVCFGECSTSGLQNEVNAYRSEIQGCHTGLLGLLAFCIYHDIHEGLITFHFDNDGCWVGQGSQGDKICMMTTRLACN